MGMDVYGKKPRSKTGKYFRNNVWWWRPLWHYCREVSPVAQKVVHYSSNGGDGLDAEEAIVLACELAAEVASGETALYAAAHKARLDAMPDEQCDLCHGTGKRTDMVVEHGCNQCLGKGTVRPWDCHYPFSVENVEKFAEFLRDSGGFEIN